MRHSTRNSVQDESASNNSAAEKSSAKKLKQARLPFKIITPSTSPAGSKSASTVTATDKDKDNTRELRSSQVKEQQLTDGRKRKLSCDEDDDESLNVINGDDNVSKENVEILTAATKKKKISTISNNDTSTEVVSLLEDDDDIVEVNEDVPNTSAVLKTPKSLLKDKRKGAGTPQTRSSVQKEKSDSASKLQIKLPLSAGKKNKRRKSKLHQLAHNSSGTDGGGSHNNSAQELSGDDNEGNDFELNPQKRKKLNDKDFEKNEKETDYKALDIDTITIDSEHEAEKEEKDEQKKERKSKSTKSKRITATEKSNGESLKKFFKRDDDHENKTRETRTANNDSKQQEKTKETRTSSKNDVASGKDSPKKISKASELLKEEEKKMNTNLDLDIGVQSENEADDEVEKSLNVSSDVNDDVKSNLNTTAEPQTDGHNTSVTGKTLTPKQIKLMEQRRKAREEKERKLQEEKLRRQQEKEERELAKKREREEKEDQKRKEREEKEEQKRKEREDKERKRLAEIEAKNEEKRKRHEAKEEELRKKEDERKRKEQEKEEAELKKKKAAQAFTKFFVAKTPISNQLKNDDDSSTEDGTKLLAFRPFQVKGDMKLAPICRKVFTPENKNHLDILLGSTHKSDEDDEDIVRRKPLPKSQLYLSELRSGKITPGKWRRPSTESKDDVIIVEDELERVGQAIIEDTPDYVREQMRVKFYKFHDNRRPPYYGTWRKKSAVVKPRRPFAQDNKIFDYEVDSDDEWEEEEPGESLEDGSDDDKEKESEDDDYEVDNEWFVPHGHLSDEELQNEDENGLANDNTREAQKVKLQILQQEFAQEMKKKTEKIKPRLIGCIWADIDGNQPSNCANILWDALEKKAMLLTEPPIVEEVETENSVETASPSSNANGNQDKLKPITLSDNMVKDLIRVIHGNNHSKNFLINEYIAYIEKTEESVKNGDLRKPLKSVVRDKIDEMAEWQVVDAMASSIQDMEQNSDETTENNKKKKKCKRRLCWVVKQDILDKMNLSSLELHNSWKYTLPPKFVKAEKDVKTEENAEASSSTTKIGECNNSTRLTEAAEDKAAGKGKEKSTTSQITKFAKVLTADEKSKKLQNAKPASSNITTDKTVTETKQSAKEKKRVPLLMSVPRGQQISTPTKNKLISQFLQQKDKEKEHTPKHSSPTTSTRSRTATESPTVEDDDVVILD